MKPLTDRQQAIYDFIVAHQKKNGFPPTIRELMAQFDIGSTNGIRWHLKYIQKKGKIRVVPGISRGIVVLEDSMQKVSPELWTDVNNFFENFYNYGFEDLEWRVEEMKVKLREA